MFSIFDNMDIHGHDIHAMFMIITFILRIRTFHIYLYSVYKFNLIHGQVLGENAQ